MESDKENPQKVFQEEEFFTIKGKKLTVKKTRGNNVSIYRRNNEICLLRDDIVKIEIDRMPMHLENGEEDDVQGIVARTGREIEITLRKNPEVIDWLINKQKTQIQALGLTIEGL